MAAELPENARTIIQAAIMLGIAVAILGAVFGFIGFIGDTAAIQPAPAGDATVLGGQKIPDAVTVSLTQEHALAFDGNDDITYGLPDTLADNASTCATPRLAAGAGLGGTYDIVAGSQNETIIAVRYSNGTYEAYATNGSHDALAVVPADSPRDYSPVCAVYNNSSILIEADGQTDTDAMDATTDVHAAAVDWVGDIDEIRWMDGELKASQRTHYIQEPVAPLPSADRLLRLMLDEGEGGTTTAYFASYDTVSVSSTSWTTGLSGPGLDAGVDYALKASPFRVVTLAGGDLVGAPVAYVTTGGPFYAVWVSVTSSIAGALALFGLAVVVLGVRSVLGASGSRGGL